MYIAPKRYVAPHRRQQGISAAVVQQHRQFPPRPKPANPHAPRVNFHEVFPTIPRGFTYTLPRNFPLSWPTQDWNAKQRAQWNAFVNTFHQHSPFYTVQEKLDIQRHMRDWEAGRKRHDAAKVHQEEEDKLRLDSLNQIAPLPPLTPAPVAFHGKKLGLDDEYDHLGAVLGQPTVFCQRAEDSCDRFHKPEIAHWPDQSELVYEGMERISTEWIHRRFLPIPRVPGNYTVTWQQRSQLMQYAFDDFTWELPTEEDLFFRWYHVPDLEVSDEDGERLLGSNLMGMLDPQDQWV